MSSKQPSIAFAITNKLSYENQDEESTENLPPSPSKYSCPTNSSRPKTNQPSIRFLDAISLARQGLFTNP